MLASHISGDIVILNREQVGNPQSCHKDCQVEIANLVGIIEHYIESFFIGPKSDHWLPLSLTHSRLVHLIDVTLVCENTKSKLVDVVTVSDVGDVCCWS